MNLRRGISAALLIAFAFLPATGAAMVVGSTFANTTVPTDDQGDSDPENDVVLLPEWFNVADNRSAVYLSDGWIISANHAIGNGTPSQNVTVTFNGLNYQGIPNTKFKLHNPEGEFSQLSNEADLVILRVRSTDDAPGMPGIKTLPNLPDLPVAESTVPNGGRVVMVGVGNNADDGPDSSSPPELYGWNQSGQNSPSWDWTWSDWPNGTEYFGFRSRTSYPRTKRWGTNVVYDTRADSGTDGQWIDFVNGYDSTSDGDTIPDSFIRSTTVGDPSVAVYGTSNDFVGVMSKFEQDPYDFNGDGFADEAQPAGGDSGGAVFSNHNGQWELAGLMHALLGYPNQGVNQGGGDTTTGDLIYGNWAFFSDLSVYQPELSSHMIDEREYSILGDLNLDGAVTASVTPSGDATGDLAMFVDGWMHQQDEGDIISWQKGDLNLDGNTNFSDYLLMRDALQASGNAAAAQQIFSLLGGGDVPEPSTLVLVLMGCVFLLRTVMRRGR